MKLKLLPIILASFMLGACGGNEPAPSSSSGHPTGLSTSEPVKWTYLDFLDNKQVRFEIYDLNSELQISYGNFALSNAISTSALNDASRMTINKSLTEGDNFHMIIVTEKAGTDAKAQVLKNIDCTQLVEFFNETSGDDLVGADRAYVTFTMGEKAKWKTGLNADLDVKLTSLVG